MFWLSTYHPAHALEKMLLPRVASRVCGAIRAGPEHVLQQSPNTLRQICVAAPFPAKQNRAAVELAQTAPPVHYLEHLDHLVAEARHRPKSSAPRKQRAPNELGEWPCRGCAKYLIQDAFRRHGEDGAQRKAICKGCENVQNRRYRNTLRGNAAVLSGSARARMKAKGQSCDLHLDDILDMLVAQGGRCAYSSIPMEILHPHSHWRMSLERKNNSDGYSRGNCLLICAEFNSPDNSRQPGVQPRHIQGTSQWSLEKVMFVSRAVVLCVDLEQLLRDIQEALTSTTRRSQASTNATKSAWKRSLRGIAMILASRARRRSAQKGLFCDIGFNNILDMLWQQGGRCFYSGIPLQYHTRHADWQMSLERLDNFHGYVKSNCVLVALEFNTADNSRGAAQEVRGTSQWSLCKVFHVWGRAGCNLQLEAGPQPTRPVL